MLTYRDKLFDLGLSHCRLASDQASMRVDNGAAHFYYTGLLGLYAVNSSITHHIANSVHWENNGSCYRVITTNRAGGECAYPVVRRQLTPPLSQRDILAWKHRHGKSHSKAITQTQTTKITLQPSLSWTGFYNLF